MTDTEPRTASETVLWHFTMSLDGSVAGPDPAMGWMTGFTRRPGLVDEYVKTTGAVLGGRSGWDAAVAGDHRPYGGAWEGPIFVLTHHGEDATPSRRRRDHVGRERPLPPMRAREHCAGESVELVGR